MNEVLNQLRELAKENGDSYFGEDDLPENFVVVVDGDWEDEGKYSNCADVYQDKSTGKFYSIYNSRSGSYYSDYYFSEAEVYEVEPKEVVKKVYMVFKEEA